jgi:mono/diheme cytochrome c family protein
MSYGGSRGAAWPPGLLLLAIVSATACAPAGRSTVEDQLARGRPIYEKGCATEKCHGVNGEGIPRGSGFQAWPLVGAEFQGRNPTAQVIFDVVRSGGEPSLRALSDQQIYDAIAYEMSLNEAAPSMPIVADNAATLPTGSAAGVAGAGELFPPPGNAALMSFTPSLTLPLAAENTEVRLRVTQVARTAAIGQSAPPAGATYLLVVITVEDLMNEPLEVGPVHLSLVGADGASYRPLEVGLAYPVDRFRAQTIEPDHGTAGVAVFAVPESESPVHLRYTSSSGPDLVLEMIK